MKNQWFTLLLLCGVLLFADVTYGQSEAQSSNKVPVDNSLIYGKLDNGLTYYVRENSLPENRAEFYLVVNAGAILENPDQNGLAHFCEHMAFNGTEHFDKHELIEYLQSIGMKFGPEINAYTTQDNTNFMLQKVPVDVPENIDTALLILYDWAGKVSYENEEIDNERGVIHEEWRVRRGADFRMMNKYQKVVFKDSKYAEHDVIGDIDIIDNFDYQTIKDFYHDWYRPNLEAVIAVGDFDAKMVEEKIKELFGSLENPENERPRENFEVPYHKETYVSVVTDPEATQTVSLVFYKQDPPKEKDLIYYRESIMQQLYTMMINNRLQELTLVADPPFVYGFSAYIPYIRTVDAYLAGAMAKNNEALSSLEAVLVENQRVKKFGFTATELERNKTELLSLIEKAYKEKDKKKSAEYMSQYQSHFLDKEPIPGIEYDFNFVKDILPSITLEEVNALAKKYIQDENRVVVISGPEKEGIVMPAEADVLAVINDAENTPVEAYVDKVTDAPLVATEPTSGKRDKKSKDKDFGTETWVFKNGVKVVIKPTEFKDDEILMTAWSYGGLSAVKTSDLPSAQLAVDIIGESGLGKHDKTSLQKKLSGKVASVTPYIYDNMEGLNGSCSPNDLETMLQLVYLNFTEPRLDKDAAAGLINRTRGMLENRSSRPMIALIDTMNNTLAQYSPREKPFTLETLDAADPQQALKLFRRRFGDPSGFTFYFVGNIDLKEARPLLEKWLGGLPVVTRTETITDHNIRPPKGSGHKDIYREMETPQGTVAIAINGEFDYDNTFDRIAMEAVKDILDVRYTETIREDEGGTYGVSIRLSEEKYPYEHYSMKIMFNSDPEKAEHLKSIVYREIQNLIAEGPADKDLKGFKENKIKTRQENISDNNYWLSMLSYYDSMGLDMDSWFEYENIVNSITAEDIQATAKKFFDKGSWEFILIPAE